MTVKVWSELQKPSHNLQTKLWQALNYCYSNILINNKISFDCYIITDTTHYSIFYIIRSLVTFLTLSTNIYVDLFHIFQIFTRVNHVRRHYRQKSTRTKIKYLPLQEQFWSVFHKLMCIPPPVQGLWQRKRSNNADYRTKPLY